MDRITKEIQRQGFASWKKAIAQSKFEVGFAVVVLAILAWNIYKANDQVVRSETNIGKVVGIHQSQGNTGSVESMLSVELKNGENVLVKAPIGSPIKSGSLVEVSRVETEQGSVYYEFQRYAEGSAE
jgi:hypothetical protein